MSDEIAEAAVVESEIKEVAAEEVPQRGGLEEAAVYLANRALDLVLRDERRLRYRAAHVVLIPVEGGESVVRLELLEKRRAWVWNRKRALQGLRPALREKPPRERDRLLNFLRALPGVSEHEGDVYIEPCLSRPLRALLDILDLERLAEAVERLLVRGLDTEEDKLEASLSHELVVVQGEPAEAHVAVDADLLVKTARNHLVAEVGEPLSDREGTRVVHDLLHAVLRDEILDFVDNVLHLADAVAGIERCPAAEGALAVPAVAARHDVGAGLTAEVAVLLGVKLPVNEVTVYPRGVGDGVLQGKRLNALGAASGDEVNKPEIPVAAGDHRPDAGLFDRLIWKRRDMVAN